MDFVGTTYKIRKHHANPITLAPVARMTAPRVVSMFGAVAETTFASAQTDV
jgi:hypothetical protein